jgi:2-dehydropantoate 2-reductase
MMPVSGENSKGMRFIIYGAGAIGGVVGGHLAMAGTNVVLIGRSGHVNAIREQGLRFITPSGLHVLKVAAVTAPGEIDFRQNDVVLFTMKSQNTEEALRDLGSVVSDVPIFCLQNGVRNEETAANYFPRVYGSYVRVGGEYLRDGEVICRRDPPGWLIMGRYPAGQDGLVDAVAAALRRAGFHVLATPDVMPYKWGKLMLNLGNAIGAITNARDGDIGRIGAAVRQEAQELLSQAGIRWVSEEQLAISWPESTERPRSVLKTEGQSSTWQSLARRQGTVEADFLNGEIVRVAKRLGKQAPLNEALSGIVREMAAQRELPGKYTPGELLKMLGLG